MVRDDGKKGEMVFGGKEGYVGFLGLGWLLGVGLSAHVGRDAPPSISSAECPKTEGGPPEL